MLLGIDLGTTHVKACAYDEDGRFLYGFSRPTPTRRLPGGGGEYHAPSLERVALEVARRVVEGVGAPEAIGVASMGESGFLVGADGEPLVPAIAWFDPRTAVQAARWHERIPPRELFLRTGLRAAPLYSACKLEWLREHRQEAWTQADGWLGMAEYLTFRMTGCRTTDHSLASRTMLLRIDRGEWDEELCALAGVPPRLLPPVFPAGAGPGRLSEAAASAISAPAGIPVVVCGHDHVCGAFGAGATAPGEVVDSIGTAEACVLPLRQPPLDEAGYELGLPVGIHVLPGLYYIAAAMPASGESVDWLLRLLGAGETDLARWSTEAQSLSPGEGGLYLPLLEGREDSRIAFHDLSLGSGPEHLLRAILEGLTMELHFSLQRMTRVTNAAPTGVTLIGGGAKNRLWRQLKADVMNLPVRVVSDPESTARGAALLAGVGAGVFADTQSVPPPEVGGTHLPSANQPEYEKLYTVVYKPMREHFRQEVG
jgi:sugar (pentulose or hexulose) kinase